jgi:hypothetical protein
MPVTHEQRVGDGVGTHEDKRETLILQRCYFWHYLAPVRLLVEHSVEDSLMGNIIELRRAV